MMIEPLHIHRGDMLRGVKKRGKDGGVTVYTQATEAELIDGHSICVLHGD
jgi:hypothetical protein